MSDDATLIQEYATRRTEEAFAELVRRHLPTVFGVALRKVNGDVHLAQDVAQSVFVDLARKAAQLGNHQVLGGWLFTSTHFAAGKAVRTEQRRRARELEALTMREPLTESGDPEDWEKLRPVLDDLLQELGSRDRDALLLRFFAGRDYPDLAKQLHLSVDGARSRVDRALEKLRARLARRGIRSSAAALAVGLSGQAALAMPSGLAGTITAFVQASPIAGAATLGGTAASILMSTSHKITLAAALSLIVVGTAVHQSSEARAAALARADAERDLTETRERLRAATTRADSRDLELAALESAAATAHAAAAASSSPSASPASGAAQVPASPVGDETLDTPEQIERKHLCFSAERVRLANGAMPLLARLGLTTDQMARTAAFASLELPEDRFSKVRLIDDFRSEMEGEWKNGLREILGEATWARFEQLQVAQAAVTKLANHLAPGETPLTSAQANELLELVAARQSSGSIPASGLVDELAPSLPGILSPEQISAWQRLSRVAEIRKGLVQRLRELDAAALTGNAGDTAP